MGSFRIVKLTDPIQFTNVAGGLVPKGAYDAGTDYAVGDSVDYNGSSYVMFADAGAGTAPTDTTKWQVLANKGNTGSTGATGAKGDTGDPGADGVVQAVVAGNGISVDSTDPANPVVTNTQGAPAWGDITGTLSDQTDLQSALDTPGPATVRTTLHLSGDYTLTADDISTLLYFAADTEVTLTIPDGLPLGFWFYMANAGTADVDITQATGGPLGSLIPGRSAVISQVDDASYPDGNTYLTIQYQGIAEGVATVVAGTNIAVDDTDPANPVVSVSGLTKSDVGLGNVDNTSNATERAATATLTNKDLTSGTNTFPTLNQNTTGSAAKLTTARTINGVSFDGSANIVIVPRTNTITSSATPSVNTDTTDIFTITALATAITSMTTNLSGTPANGQKLTVRILDNGTARAITWGASFVSRGSALPTTTVVSKYLYVGFIYNSTAAVWDCVSVAQEF